MSFRKADIRAAGRQVCAKDYVIKHKESVFWEKNALFLQKNTPNSCVYEIFFVPLQSLLEKSGRKTRTKDENNNYNNKL